jgi:hypothetical protein
MQISRSRERIIVEIPIVVTTVLESLDGTIVDLSEGGAQIVGCSLPAKSQCQIDLDGHIVFGTVRWSEIDRMGIRFPYEMTEGPLFDLLEQARAALRPIAPIRQRMPVAAFASAGGSGFGRRGV